MVNETREGPPATENHSHRTQIAAWLADVSKRQRRVEWRMKTDNARCRLKASHARMILRRTNGARRA